MKFLEYIDYLYEAPVFDDTNLRLGSSASVWEKLNDTYANIKKRPLKLGNFDVKIDKDDDNFHRALFNYEGNVIAYLYWTPFDIGTRLLPAVNLAIVHPSYRGQGVADEIYSLMIGRYGGIVSDVELTGFAGKGAFNLWVKLSKKYMSYIYSEGKLTIVPEFERNQMGNKNSRFVILNRAK